MYKGGMEFVEVNKNQKDYPPLLREMANPPEKLYIRGILPDFYPPNFGTAKVGRVNLPWVAIVGTRKATLDGIELARKVAKTLAEQGFIIVSGLAMGIDSAAHDGALKGNGQTVAVLGNGIDRIYPAQNQNLANKILESGGAIISEYEPGTTPMQFRFLERNRIVAGLCVATIVIEAPKKSGAIVTARLAAESGREVFVFPGPAGHPQYAGSHALIRDGARLVNSIDDILEDLSLGGEVSSGTTTMPEISEGNFMEEAKTAKENIPRDLFSKREKQNQSVSHEKLSDMSDISKEIYNILSKSKVPLSLDKIIEYTKLTAKETNGIISELIIYGIVLETSSGYKLNN